MEAIYQSIILFIGRTIKPVSKPLSLWRKLAPVQGLLFLVAFYLTVSCLYIVFFIHSFNFGKRIIALHLSIISAGVVVLVFCLGFLLRFRRIREWPPIRFILAFLLATGFSILVVLYFADYFSNRLWGSNITYELASKYIFSGGVLQKELQLLASKYYLLLAGSLLVIYSIHLGFSNALISSIAALFIPDRESSIFRDRRQAGMFGAGLFFSLLLIVLAGFEATRIAPHFRSRILSQEPIISFILNNDGLTSFVSNSTRIKIRAEEAQLRANYSPGPSFEKKNVVIIMVDSLRADHLPMYGYKRPTTPFLSGLGKTGHLKMVEMATSTCSDTKCGVLSTLSSQPLKRLIPENFKLQDLLYDQGYKVYFILSGNHRWYDLKNCYGTSLTYYFDGTESISYDWNDDRVLFEGLEKVPDFVGTPAFFYFHLMSTHSTGIRLTDYSKYLPARNYIEINHNEFDALSANNYYDNGIIQADATIKQLFERLKEKGYLDNSLIVILADHGEALGQSDHSTYSHGTHLYQECIRIPLMIYDESKTKYADLKYATQIDVAPTILSRLGLAIPESWHGRSLLTSNNEQYSFHQTIFQHPSYAVIYRTDRAIYKYLKHHDLGEELYELISDPNEKRNLISTVDPTIVDHLRSKLSERITNN